MLAYVLFMPSSVKPRPRIQTEVSEPHFCTCKEKPLRCTKLIKSLSKYINMTDENKQILKELREMRADIDYIKRHVIDADIILTSDDLESLEEAEKDFKEGKTRKIS